MVLFLDIAALAARRLGESIVPPSIKSADDVPADYKQMSPAWLTAVLCEDVPGGEILSVKRVGGSSGTSTRTALQLELNAAAKNAGVTDRVFVKSTRTLNQRMLLGISKVIYGEVGFFGQFRQQIDIEAPAGYYAKVEPKSLRSAVLMEDVTATKGAVFNDLADAVSPDQMKQLLDGFAILHGKFWGSKTLRDAHPHLRDAKTYLDDVNSLIDMSKRASIGADRGTDLIPETLHGRTRDIWNVAVSATREAVNEPMTLLHGDGHIAQTYQTKDGRMGIADWQVLIEGPWAWDVSYMMSTGLSVEDRRTHERDLLRYYLEKLEAAGGPKLNFDDAFKRYRQFVCYAYIAWTFTLGKGAMQPDMQPEQTVRNLVERTANAVNDLKSLESV